MNCTADPERKMINPDELKDGIQQLIDPKVRTKFYLFIAHYVRKVWSDNKIVKEMRNTARCSFPDLIGASDITYVLTILKNNRDMWDDKLERNELLGTEGTGNVAQGSGMYMHVANDVFSCTSQFTSLARHVKVTRESQELYSQEESVSVACVSIRDQTF